MTPANDIEPLARDAPACTEMPGSPGRKQETQVAPGLAVALIALGVSAALIGLVVITAVFVQWLRGIIEWFLS